MFGLRRVMRGDSGFTIVEVVFASAILFIALTALLSLMTATTFMNVRAKERANMTNAVNSFIEQARGMGYDDIGVPGGDPLGTLVPQTVITNGLEIQMNPVVSWVDDPKITGAQDYKKLVITVVATPQNGSLRSISFVAQALIKPSDSGMSNSAQQPTITFTNDSEPSNGTIGGTAVRVGALAVANGTNVKITSLNFYDGHEIFLLNSSGVGAQWAFSAPMVTQLFYWDTTQKNEDGSFRTSDGWQTVKLQCFDSNGRSSFVQRSYFIDNNVPNTPSSVEADDYQGGIRVSWPVTMDGNSPTDHYRLKAEKSDASGVWQADMAYTDIGATSVTFDSASLSYYRFFVVAAGPGNTKISGEASCTGVSGASIVGTCANKMIKNRGGVNRDTYTQVVTITVAPATFPFESVSNTLLRGSSAGSVNTTIGASSSGWTFTDSQGTPTNPITNPLPARYYRVKTVIRPTGGSSYTVYSNVVGGTPPAGASYEGQTVVTTLPNAGW